MSCLTIAVVFLALVAITHLLRLFAGWEVVVAGLSIPVWWSAFGLLIGLIHLAIGVLLVLRARQLTAYVLPHPRSER